MLETLTRMLLASGEEEDFALTSNCMFVALSVLVLLSVLFEITKTKITLMATEFTKPIVENLWMELTVLGFLSLLSFLVVKAGVLTPLSEKLFDG